MLLLSQIITIGILATLVMTCFSYGISYFSKSKFEEPQLLNALLDRLSFVNRSFCKEHIIGWVLHICIGIFFVASFRIFYELRLVDTTLRSGILFGFLGGVAGVVFWMILFRLHPNPPQIDKITYYIQLVVAHILFGICTALLFKELLY